MAAFDMYCPVCARSAGYAHIAELEETHYCPQCNGVLILAVVYTDKESPASDMHAPPYDPEIPLGKEAPTHTIREVRDNGTIRTRHAVLSGYAGPRKLIVIELLPGETVLDLDTLSKQSYIDRYNEHALDDPSVEIHDYDPSIPAGDTTPSA